MTIGDLLFLIGRVLLIGIPVAVSLHAIFLMFRGGLVKLGLTALAAGLAAGLGSIPLALNSVKGEPPFVEAWFIYLLATTFCANAVVTVVFICGWKWTRSLPVQPAAVVGWICCLPITVALLLSAR